MSRYHKAVYIPEADKLRLEAYTRQLNALKWGYTRHTLDNLKYRSIRLEDVLNFIKGVILNEKNIFEYYKDEKNNIIKACYRVKYSQGMDLILILSDIKNIITIYLNTSDDLHYTLKKSLYKGI
jgi:hypothetical protein